MYPSLFLARESVSHLILSFTSTFVYDRVLPKNSKIDHTQNTQDCINMAPNANNVASSKKTKKKKKPDPPLIKKQKKPPSPSSNIDNTNVVQKRVKEEEEKELVGVLGEINEDEAKKQRQHAVVLVLGDFGHSPRMQNHAISLLNKGYVVTVIAYKNGSMMKEKLRRENDGFRFVGISRLNFLRVKKTKIPFVPSTVYFSLRVLLQFLQVLLCLFFETGKVKVTNVLVQNPPCLPTFLACAVAKRVMGGKFTIDWHNLGYSIFSMQRKRGGKDVLVRVMKAYEKYFLRYFDHHLTVTEKMKDFLIREWRVDARHISVVKDAPGEQFLRLNTNATREKKKGFRKKTSDVVNVVSSTSWTPDEDFDVLLHAAVLYDEKAKEASGTATKKKKKTKQRLPHLNILITGRGDLRESFETRAKEAKLKHVSFSYAWLPIHEYPERLSMSDVGLCLHQSSSKLDLPMKIVDMFGVGIPVLARRYECLRDELVQEGVNGLTFDTSEELCDALISLLEGWDGNENGTEALNRLEAGVTRDRLDEIFSSSSSSSSLSTTAKGRRKVPATRPPPPRTKKKYQLEDRDAKNSSLDEIEDEGMVDFWEENWTSAKIF